MKALIIGLDGATWEIFDDSLLENHMPNLNRLKKCGYWGILRSTYPPLTSAAWTSCITGCQPYKHGVVGFLNFFSENNSVPASSAASCRVPTLWEHLSSQGYRVASINVPWTYPCRKVNGVMVAGYGVPGMDVEFTWPPEFGRELLAKIPDYEVIADWDEPKGPYDSQLLDKNLRNVEHRFTQRVEAAQLAYDRFSPDVMMVQFQNTDRVEHRIFEFVSARTRDRYPHRDRIYEMFEKLDDCIGRILKLAGGENCSIMVVSDHGLCKTRGLIRPNALLYKWGYLKSKPWLGRLVHRIRGKLEKSGILKNPSPTVEQRKPVDWKKSRAMVMSPAMMAYVYLNVKGRNKNGCISPGQEYDLAIKDLREKFSNVRHPVTKEPLFEFVGTPAELYGIENPPNEILGDLALVPKYGYQALHGASRKADAVKILNDDSVVGTHCYEGIYIFKGPNIRKSQGPQAHITDVAPTLMGLLGAKIPPYMDGEVVKNAFLRDIEVKYQSGSKEPPARIQEIKKLTKKEDMEITKRLSDLGYMD